MHNTPTPKIRNGSASHRQLLSHSFTASSNTHRTLYCSRVIKSTLKLDFSPSRLILQVLFGNKAADTMVADALIYHPTVSHYLKFIATTGMSSSAPIQSFPACEHDASRVLVPALNHIPIIVTCQCQPLTHPLFSWSRQAPPHTPVLFAFSSMVPVPYQPSPVDHQPVRGDKEAVWRNAQADACGQVRRALQGCGGCE